VASKKFEKVNLSFQADCPACRIDIIPTALELSLRSVDAGLRCNSMNMFSTEARSQEKQVALLGLCSIDFPFRLFYLMFQIVLKYLVLPCSASTSPK
jgi:hypothetical protein